jgi:hypothetical protein
MRSTTIGLCALVLPAALIAQVETSTSIRGLVTDPTGAAVPGASVVVRNTETNEERIAGTDATGFYAFPSLIPGTYDVTVSHPGFKRGVVAKRVAEASQSAQVDFALQIGETSDSVTVSGEGAELITTTSAEVAGVITSQMADTIPLNGRDFFDLTAVLPFVSTQSEGNQLSQASRSMNLTLGLAQNSPLFRSSGVFAAGNRDSATNTSIDGLNVQSSIYGQTTSQQPPSAIQEMKVHVSSMNAEFGNGVAAFNIITKNGTNSIHGEAFEFFRNDKLDANNFFNNLNNRSKSPYRQNQFGAAAGGPIRKDKIFFFGSYEGLRTRQANLDVSVSPPICAPAISPLCGCAVRTTPSCQCLPFTTHTATTPRPACARRSRATRFRSRCSTPSRQSSSTTGSSSPTRRPAASGASSATRARSWIRIRGSCASTGCAAPIPAFTGA